MNFNRRTILCYVLCLFVLCGCSSHVVNNSIKYTQLPVLKVQIDNVELGYRIIGNGEPLLMIMGYACSMDVWDYDLIAELAKYRKIILFDNRGVASSTIDHVPLTIELMTKDAVSLLDALNIRKADVMGWSMGAIIAQEMALSYPEKVGKTILYGAAIDMQPVKNSIDGMAVLSPEQFVERIFPEPWKELNPDAYSRLPVPSQVSVEVIGQQYDAITHWSGTRKRIAGIQGEVLLVVGENDRITPVIQSLEAAKLIEGAWLVRFKGADHYLMYQNPKDLAKTVELFLGVKENLLKQ